MSKKVSRATEVVQRAAALYPKALNAATVYLGTVPYGVQQLDPRTIDRRLERMSIEEATLLSSQDPSGTVAQRLAQLDARAAALPPDANYEGE